MLADCLPNMLAETERLRRRFAGTAATPWDPVTAAAELSVQLGHVSTCLLRTHGPATAVPDDLERPITDVGDELADVILATLSACTLAGVVPTEQTRGETRKQASFTTLFLQLAVASGTLAEATMINAGLRHLPTGRRPDVAQAAANVLDVCTRLAAHFDLDLVTEFATMVADADAFLDDRGVPR